MKRGSAKRPGLLQIVASGILAVVVLLVVLVAFAGPAEAAKNLPPVNPKDKGHYHPECAEFWLIMSGQIRYPIEDQGVIIANVGDVVYVPPFTFHAPRWYGEGASCRLAMNGYANIAHLFESAQPH
jgi:hypothetical protein